MWSRIASSHAAATADTASRSFRPGAGGLVGALLAVVAYRDLLLPPKFSALDHAAVFWLMEPGYTWAPPVVAGALWLLYRRRGRWARLPERQAPGIGAALLVLGVVFFVWAQLTGASDLLVPSLMANAFGLAWLRKGRAGARVLALPVLFLVFAWPLPPRLLNELVWPLQMWTAAAAGGFLQAVGMPALVETILVSRPGWAFAFVESCSGFRIMELLTAVAVLMRERAANAGLRSWLVVLAAPLLAAGLNAIRVFVVVASSDPAAVNDHLAHGLLMLGGGTLGLALLARGLAAGAASPVPAAGAGREGGTGPQPARWIWAPALGLCALSLLPSPWSSEISPEPALHGRIPAEHAGWVAQGNELDPHFLGTVRFRDSVNRRYSRDGREVSLFVGAGGVADRRTSPFSPKTLLPGMRWRLESSGSVHLEELGITAESAVVERDGERWLVYHWRRGDIGVVAGALRHGLAIDRTPLGRDRERAVLWLATPLQVPEHAPPGEDGAETLERFVRDFRSFLERSAGEPGLPTAA